MRVEELAVCSPEGFLGSDIPCRVTLYIGSHRVLEGPLGPAFQGPLGVITMSSLKKIGCNRPGGEVGGVEPFNYPL